MQTQPRDHREDVLLGVLSVQLGLVDPSQVMAAERSLTQRDAAGRATGRSTATLADALEQTGALDASRRTLLETIRAEFLASHDGDATRALDALGENALAATFGLAATVNDEGKLLVGIEGQHGVADPLAPAQNAVAAESDTPVVVTREHPGRYTGPHRDGLPPAPEPLELGRGGIGRVLIAHDAHLGREVAVKELLPRDGAGGKPRSQSNPRNSLAAARFLREARLTGQLEHPNIVPVYELGRRTDGTLYYTMKVVRGRNLADALAATKSLADRLRLLKHVADLTDAIAYAHSRGVIHRDIKPENVMVGEFGETVVLDWGLAKPRGAQDLGVAGTPRSLSISESGDDDLAKTTDGTLIGTPLFMSPEQAQGDTAAVDERTDVWALGIVLYELLTGAPPFTGRTATELLVNICRAPLPPVLERCPEAPPELAAIAERALRRDRFQRYATAREMAEEIRAFMTGGRVRAYTYGTWELIRRWAARHKGALAVASVAVVALIALGVWSFVEITGERDVARDAERRAARLAAETEVSRQAAVAAEKTARTTRDSAEQLVRYMLGDLKDKLEPLGQIPLLDGVARAAETYYGSDPSTAAPGETSAAGADATLDVNRLRNRAGVVALVADLARMKGDLAAAATGGAEAEALRERLLRAHPDNMELVADRAESFRQRGLLLRMQGDLAGAKIAFAQALAARRLVLGEGTSATPQAMRDVIDSELDLGDISILMGDPASGEDAYAKAVTNAETAVAGTPGDLQTRFVLTVARDALGTVRLDRGNVDGAEDAFKRALVEREALVAAAPGNLAWQHRLSVSHSRLAEVARARGAHADARGAWQHALDLMERVAGQDPMNARWQRDLAVNWNRLGDLDMERSSPADALVSYQRAHTFVSALAAKDPSNAELQRDLEVGTDRVGDAQFALGQLEAAGQSFRAALAIAETLATLDASNARWQHDLGLALGRVAQITWRSGDLDGAKPHAARAVEVLTALVAKDPANAAWATDLQAARDNQEVYASGNAAQLLTPPGIGTLRLEATGGIGSGAPQPPSIPNQRPDKDDAKPAAEAPIPNSPPLQRPSLRAKPPAKPLQRPSPMPDELKAPEPVKVP